MRVFIGADIVPTQSNSIFFESGQINEVVDEQVLNKLKSADFRVFNLEVPLTDCETPIKKCGPSLIAATSCVNGIKKLGVDLLTVANNHIMDHGIQGLKSTIEVLKKNKIDFVGAGNTLKDAQQPYIIEKDGIKVGIYACAEHEFSIAEENYPGANPFEPLDSLDHIMEIKGLCDYVIVLYHGGKEYYRYPSPYLQKVCRRMCDKGADLVVCQHSHCVGCEEKYGESTIVYGQGNFIFDAKSDEFWDNSILIDVNIDAGGKNVIKYIALEKKNGMIVFSTNDNELKKFYERSNEIKDPNFIVRKYSDFACNMVQNYMDAFESRSLIFKVINKFSGYRLKRKKSKKQKLAIINFIECEAHRELFIRGMKEK